jgi:hypothetical protein
VLVLPQALAQSVEILFLMVSLQLVVVMEVVLLVMQRKLRRVAQEVQEVAVCEIRLQELSLVEPQMQQHKEMMVDSLMQGARTIQQQEVEVQDSRDSRLKGMETTDNNLVVMDYTPLSQVHLFGEEAGVQVIFMVQVIMLVVEVEVVMAQQYMMMLLELGCTEMINLVVEVQEPQVIKTEVTEVMGLS